MSQDLFNLFEEMDDIVDRSDYEPLRAPFAYPGGKSRSADKIVSLLPDSKIFVDVFGGGASILLAKPPSPLEIFNDRFAGVIAFYRCIRDAAKLDQLVQRLEVTLHSREEFEWCKETWEQCTDDVERAARWYYMNMTSFGSIGRNWGRALSPPSTMAGKIQRKLKHFNSIHHRFKSVQIENRDWALIIRDFDSPDTVFYMDPPYMQTDCSMYTHNVNHSKLLGAVDNCEGYVALSSYKNPLYDAQDWDEIHTWDVHISMKSTGGKGKGNKKGEYQELQGRQAAQEVLYVRHGSLA